MKAVLTIAFAVLVAASAGAQQLKIAFNQGHVTVDATGVPARTILTEWGKLGGTKVTGVERMSGTPLTLKLEDVPEAQALDIILRSAAGYLAAPRPLAQAGNGSIYDRILVMATSSAPAAPAAARPATNNNQPGPTSGVQRFIPPGRVQQQEPPEEEEREEEVERPNQPVFTFPQPGNGMPQFGPQGGAVISVDPRTGQPQTITINPAPQPAGPTTPYSGFGGAVGSPTPGMIVQPPSPQPGQALPSPGTTRPPGRQQQ